MHTHQKGTPCDPNPILYPCLDAVTGHSRFNQFARKPGGRERVRRTRRAKNGLRQWIMVICCFVCAVCLGIARIAGGRVFVHEICKMLKMLRLRFGSEVHRLQCVQDRIERDG